MRKFILALSLGLLLVLPVTSFAQSGGDDVITIETLIAQIKALQQQILLLQQNSGGGSGAGNIGGGGTSTSGGTIVPEMCLRLTYSLYAGQTDAVTGGEVSKLQQFLAGDASLYPEGLVTGFFGPATERAVQRLQTKHGIISSGSPDTTGYGFVGPQTRAVLQKEGVCGGGGGGGYGASPVIHGVKGPTSLAVGEEGAWAIEASNANGGYLSYSVTWGDEGYNIYPNQSAPSVIPQRQSSTFTHIYRNSGNYTPQFKVTNDRGLGAGASLSVVVGSGVTPPPVPGPLTIKTSSNLNGSVGTYFQATFEAFGWRSPIKFQVSEGRLPAGLELVPAPVYALGIPCYIDSCLTQEVRTVLVQGTPKEAGTFTFILMATDASGVVETAKFTIWISSSTQQQPSVTVIYPNGGEIWTKGTSQLIKWRSSNYTGLVDITIANTSGSYRIAMGVPSTDSYSWVVGNGVSSFDIPIGGDYMIYVSDNSNTGAIVDSSNSPFSIVSSTTPPPTTQARLKVSVDPSFFFTNKVTAGDTRVLVAQYELTASDGDVLLNSLALGSNSSNAPSNFTNFQLYSAGDNKLLAQTNLAGTAGRYSLSAGFKFYGLRIPANTTRRVFVTADVPTTASGVSLLGLSSLGATSADGLVVDTTITNTYDVAETILPPTCLNDAAAFVSQDGLPLGGVGPGQWFTVTIKMKNTGCTTWTNQGNNPIRLGSQSTQDNTRWGTHRVSATGDVPPGQIGTFVMNLTAPQTTGTHNFQWRMVHEIVRWFGDYTPNVPIPVGYAIPNPPSPTVYFPDLTVVTVGVSPSNPVANQQVLITATVKNIGNASTSGASFSIDLGSTPHSIAQYVSSASSCGLYINLQPGATCNISYNITYTASSSSNTATLVIDPNGYVSESDESNNRLPFAFSIGGTATSGGGGGGQPSLLPDLALSDILLSPTNPMVNGPTNISTTVTNKGTIAASGASFSVDLGATSRSSAQLVTSGSSCGLYINLQPGASCSISYNIVYSSTSSVSSNNVTIRADSNNTVVESDETNNTKALTFPISLGGASSASYNQNLANTISAMQRELENLSRHIQLFFGR